MAPGRAKDTTIRCPTRLFRGQDVTGKEMHHAPCEWAIRLFMTAMRPIFCLSIIAWIALFLLDFLVPEADARCDEYIRRELHDAFLSDGTFVVTIPGSRLGLAFLALFCCGYSLYLNGYYWAKLHLKRTYNRLWSPFPITYRKRTSHLLTMIPFREVKCVSRFAAVAYAACAVAVVAASIASGRSCLHIAFLSCPAIMLVSFVVQVVREKGNRPAFLHYLDCLSLLWTHICVSAAMLFIAGAPVAAFFHASEASIWAAALWLLLATLCYVMGSGFFATVIIDLFFCFRRRFGGKTPGATGLPR